MKREFELTKPISKMDAKSKKQHLNDLLKSFLLDSENLSEKGKNNLIKLLVLERGGFLDTS